MTAAELLQALWETASAATAACLLVLLLRRPVRRLAGGRVAYALWGMVPAAAIAVLLPAPVGEIALPAVSLSTGGGLESAATADRSLDWTWALPAAWIAGVAWCGARLVDRQRRFVRALGRLQARPDGLWQAEAVDGLPAVIGLRARVVVPADFERRFTARERDLIVAHERSHARRGDLHANALAAGLACLYWFNPLLPFALDRFRRDQELACDQAVLARHPGSRRLYGEAMLKAGGAMAHAPLSCQWFGHHPLKERIAMLAAPLPGPRRRMLGTAVVLALTAAAAYGAWAQQPQRARPGPPVATTAATPPAERMAALGEREVSPSANDRSAGAMAAGTGGETRLDGDGARFVPRGAATPASSGPQAREDAPAKVDARSKTMAPPKYPAAAADAKVTGKVILVVEVAADGSVSDVQVETSEPRGVFDAAAVEAARKWNFDPAVRNGRPVAGRVRVPVWFEMDPPEAEGGTAGG